MPFDLLKEWESHGFKCRVITSGWDSPNGYVAVPKEHPYWGESTHNIGTLGDVHGGITFSRQGSDEDKLFPNPDLWWFGFDTHHIALYDWVPFAGGNRKHWTTEEVVEETEKLARALIERFQILEETKEKKP